MNTYPKPPESTLSADGCELGAAAKSVRDSGAIIEKPSQILPAPTCARPGKSHRRENATH